MEFKDNLKRLRTERGLTQSQLAEQLFVSRSTVAKWENGLGLPSEESMAAIEALFGVSRSELKTSEPETVIVQKNRRLHLLGQTVTWVLLLALTALSFALPIAIVKGEYGFVPDMLVGGYADEESIDTGDYRIYFYVFEDETEDGQHWILPQGYRVVRKHFWGCTPADDDVRMQVLTKDNYVVGRLCTIKGKNGYYHMIRTTGFLTGFGPGAQATVEYPAPELLTATSVRIGSVEYPLERGFFFVTDEPVGHFWIDDQYFDVIE